MTTAAQIIGRQVVAPLVNKSGGSVTAGDVVIVDITNDRAFTTTTTADYNGPVGVVLQDIPSNATGLVLIFGYAPLVNVTASVSRGHFCATSTTVKQAKDAAASRQTGTFGIFMSAGTTPDAIIWQPDFASAAGAGTVINPSVVTNILAAQMFR